jgi:PAS domain-containing protein
VEQRCASFRARIEQSANLVIITDRNGTIEYVNPKFSPGDRLYRRRGHRRQSAHSQIRQNSLNSTSDCGKPSSAASEWRGEFRNRRKDGALYWESASIAPIRDEKGKASSPTSSPSRKTSPAARRPKPRCMPAS